MKKISILIPTFNEEKNVKPLSEELVNMFKTDLSDYDYEIIYIDNCSEDLTRSVIRNLCEDNCRIKAIFNAKNFGQFNSPYYGLQQITGDCVVLMCADFQDPVEMVPRFVEEWENGYKIVVGQKTKSKENKVMYFFRSCYYNLIKKFSNVEQIEHFTGFGLYDKSFIQVLSDLKDPTPFLRGIVAELGYKQKVIPYEQQKRRAGKTSNNLYKLYDAAMLSFTSYTKIGLRLATFVGVICGVISFIVAIIYLILKIVYWDRFVAGMAPILIGMFILGSVQLIFIGLIGEYILSMNARIMNRPLVIEEERLNFETFDIEKENQHEF
ncbi:glycosyltransferase family 2 protein [[Clostridium] hylemonae]|uniref:Glycosyltransferase, group 2 family protein n=1 Tax=[Clostridium] hylemonae DSM 15053 TaxID=553973 RepID=C0C2E3_9FIRM|nr:glycosyltransferase family 2 protein [[Clostridium] hylemonae]EEG73567.1 glycosyltransferase, group 2 family protein [[Clostridium] hylemonae DSM 15053]QEK17169.1 Prophage bactoprenol glucosyl transferase [[Clostridium] hylemonae DSM 15053]